MGTEQAKTKKKKDDSTIVLFNSYLKLNFVKFLLNRMNSYIMENGKAVWELLLNVIQQTYDLQVNGYYSQLHLLEWDSLIQEE